MLVDDGAITLWIPEGFTDESEYGFRIAEKWVLRLGPYGIPPAGTPFGAIADQWTETKSLAPHINPMVTVHDSVQPTTFAGLPAAIGFLEMRADGKTFHKAEVIARIEDDRGLMLEQELDFGSTDDPAEAEATFRKVAGSAWLLATGTPPNDASGWSLRNLGAIGLELPNQAEAIATYRFQHPSLPLRITVSLDACEESICPHGYFDEEDQVAIESQSEPHQLVLPNSPMGGEELTYRLRRQREAQGAADFHQPEVDDLHHVRRAVMVHTQGLDPKRRLVLIAACPVDFAAELDALWARILPTCRLTGND